MNAARKLLLTLTLAVMAVSSSFANSKVQLDNWLERLGVLLIGQQLGIDSEMVYDNLGWGRSVYEITPVYVIHDQTRRNPDEIWRLRQQGLGWGQIARKVGMHPGTFNKLQRAGMMDNDSIWENWLGTRYSLSDAQINYMRNLGFSWGEMTGIAHIAHRSGATLKQVVQRWQQEQRWDRVREHYKIRDDWGPGRWKADWTRGKSTWSNNGNKQSDNSGSKVRRQTNRLSKTKGATKSKSSSMRRLKSDDRRGSGNNRMQGSGSGKNSGKHVGSSKRSGKGNGSGKGSGNGAGKGGGKGKG